MSPYSEISSAIVTSAEMSSLSSASSPVTQVSQPQPALLSAWKSAQAPLLPPEPDRLADPFDIGWADRAISSFSPLVVTQPQQHLLHSVLSTAPGISNSLASRVQGPPGDPMSTTNPFLA
ncbi:unnamed protein product [Protopolystoma xenopodis]|uniref:Uncharacterized protein n=1 Tax=Protopolystoma xenopodis TaxID=117903 RepID=A0A448WRA7_9PLAT|nr:unnamed protein product [Protopolystoma xenopodis]